MRIAFVGKGGSGKTTLSALFGQYVSKDNKPVLIFDADLNIHLPELLGFYKMFSFERHLSNPIVAKQIKNYLKGGRTDIKTPDAFRKTTPPTSSSELIKIRDQGFGVLEEFLFKKDNLSLLVIGTYDDEQIGASCYHNNLAIFENILSHLIDNDGYVVADMVAGVDAFANTLHAQFDILCLVVEPTKRSVEVFEHYKRLAEEAGTEDSLMVVANKIRNKKDKDFIDQHIPQDQLIGFFKKSEYLKEIEQKGGSLDVNLLEPQNKELLKQIKNKLISVPKNPQKRLEKLWQLHKVYVAQAPIMERFGDLTNQIDPNFKYE